jgi:hypothetical protein
MIKDLTVEQIESGELLTAANESLREICRDVIERPHIKKARELTIKIVIEPYIRELRDRSVNQPGIGWSIGKAMPGCKGMVTRAFVVGDRVVVDTDNPLGDGVPGQHNLPLDEANQ